MNSTNDNNQCLSGPELYRRAKQLIPGGTQLLSKRPEMFLPDLWPSYYRRAKGIQVEDLDGRKFLDFSIMGVGACVLGYADPDVDSAVKEAVDAGVMCTLNAPEEVELAELLCELHPWAGMVRYARAGGEAMAQAVRIARAHTGRDHVAICGYHGWQDWYLAANLGSDHALDGHLMPGLPPRGVPRKLQGTASTFHYNCISELKAIVDKQGQDLAAIVMEPQRGQTPREGFLHQVREISSDLGAVLIFDEITTGFRMNTGGIHLLHGVDPDIAVFAKAMANGYAMSAVLGTVQVMQSAQESFISSTNWTERLGPSAALATIRKHRDKSVADHLIQIGNQVQLGWRQAAEKHNLALLVDGLPSLCHFSLQHDQAVALSTLFTQEMLKHGYLAFEQFKPSYAHQPEDATRYLAIVDQVFAELSSAINAGSISDCLTTAPARRGFYRLAE